MSGGAKKFKDFTPSQELQPHMKSQGFIVDRYLSKVGTMLKQKGIDCKIVDTDDSNAVAI